MYVIKLMIKHYYLDIAGASETVLSPYILCVFNRYMIKKITTTDLLMVNFNPSVINERDD